MPAEWEARVRAGAEQSWGEPALRRERNPVAVWELVPQQAVQAEWAFPPEALVPGHSTVCADVAILSALQIVCRDSAVPEEELQRAE